MWNFFLRTGVMPFAMLACSSLNAALLLEYQTASSSSNPELTPSQKAAEISADKLSAGSGIIPLNTTTYNWNNWDTASKSFSAAVAANDFWTWGFDVTSPSHRVVPTTMDIRLDRSLSGPDDFAIQASVNGGTALTLLTHDFNDSGASVDFRDVNLTAIGTLTQGDSVTFTLAAYNSESSSGTFDLETISSLGSALQIRGDLVAMPEPSAFWFCAVASSLSFASKRRRRRE